jgi:D-beta-D-heptose 7-phosphate kinase/D-beta-D-heptose 1-phosphate adenosyltransferase
MFKNDLINKSNLVRLINNFSKQSVLVIGDLMIDKYLWCDINRISPEAPVPVALVKSESYVLGGAANVANNLVALGATVNLVGLIGNDEPGRLLTKELQTINVSRDGLLVDLTRPTIIKQRVMCGAHQSIRIDYEDVKEINQVEEKKILNYVTNLLDKVKIIIFSDYAKGLISEKLAQSIIALAIQKNIKVLADPTPNTFKKFSNSYLIKPNKKEAEAIANEKFNKDYSNLSIIGEKIRSQLNSNLVITLGKDGVAVFNESKLSLLPTFAREVYDVSGAGDTTIAALALSLASGASLEDATAIGNYCAGVVVSKIGTASCSLEELLRVMQN